MAVHMPRWRFTVDDYYRMAETGILTERDRVELVEGEVIRMSPIGSMHAACVKRAANILTPRLQGQAVVSVQDPVRLSDHSEPQTDIALLRPRDDFYAGSHPGPDDVLLILEVADTTLAYDRQVKVPVYARAGIPEVWLADLPGDAMESHREPSPDGYRIVQRYRRGERIAPQRFPDFSIGVEDLLGPPGIRSVASPASEEIPFKGGDSDGK
jgi:Uma2 family endonuclease